MILIAEEEMRLKANNWRPFLYHKTPIGLPMRQIRAISPELHKAGGMYREGAPTGDDLIEYDFAPYIQNRLVQTFGAQIPFFQITHDGVLSCSSIAEFLAELQGYVYTLRLASTLRGRTNWREEIDRLAEDDNAIVCVECSFHHVFKFRSDETRMMVELRYPEFRTAVHSHDNIGETVYK